MDVLGLEVAPETPPSCQKKSQITDHPETTFDVMNAMLEVIKSGKSYRDLQGNPFALVNAYAKFWESSASGSCDGSTVISQHVRGILAAKCESLVQ